MIKYILLLIAGTVVTGAMAQQTYTLDQCREMAMTNNTAIKNATLSTEASKEVRKEAFTKYFPNVSASGLGFITDKGLLQYDFDEEIKVPLVPGIAPDGMTLPLSYDFNLIKKGIMTGVNLVQPVFWGGLIANGNKLAEVGEAVAELQGRQSQDQVALTVEQYYWQLASLKAKRQTVNDVMAMLDTLVYQVDVAVKAGVTMPNDLLQVKLRRNEMETASIELENGISIVSTLLGQYIGLGTTSVHIADTFNPHEKIAAPTDLFVNPADALYATNDYQLLQQGVKAADLTEKMAVGANLPKVAVGAGYFYENILRQGHGCGALYATVAVPITDWWGGSHSIKQKKLQAQIARNNLEDFSELLQVKMTNAWNDVNTAYRKIGVANQSIEQATENLRLNTLYYKAGTVTITDLLTAQTLFRQSRDQYIDALGDYRIKTVEYLQSTGR